MAKPPFKRADPPRHLSPTAKRHWRELRAVYALDSPDQLLLLLRAACEAADRCESARKLVAAKGEVIPDRFGQLRQHPGVNIERDARAAMVQALKALGLQPDVMPPCDRVRRDALPAASAAAIQSIRFSRSCAPWARAAILMIRATSSCGRAPSRHS